MVLLFDLSSPFSLMKKQRDGNVLQLITKLKVSGQIILILCKHTLLLRLLKAFIESIWITAA